jgi:hypothetical protein
MATNGRCNACGAVIAWHRAASGWLLCNPKLDANGQPERVQVKNGKGRLTWKKVPDTDKMHTCEGALEGKKRASTAAAPQPAPPSTPEREIDPEYQEVSAKQCKKTSGGWYCTRTQGHTGEHVACLAYGVVGRPNGRWPNEAVPSPWKEKVEAGVKPSHGDIEGMVRGTMKTILDEYGIEPPAARVEVVTGSVVRRVDGITHPNLPRLIGLIARRRNVYLHGPSGNGKTYAGGQAADAVGLRYAVMSMPGIQSPSRIFGFENARGEFVSTVFAEYFERGGVLIADELDRMIPQVATSLNSTLENRQAVFGGRVVNAHPDFVMVATGNTDMRGATMDYTAGQPQDYSTAARFAFLEWPNDEETERKLVAAIIERTPAGKLVDFMGRLRKAVKLASLEKILCGPRESMRIAEDLRHGATIKDALDTWVRRGLDQDAWDSLILDAGGMLEVSK